MHSPLSATGAEALDLKSIFVAVYPAQENFLSILTSVILLINQAVTT